MLINFPLVTFAGCDVWQAQRVINADTQKSCYITVSTLPEVKSIQITKDKINAPNSLGNLYRFCQCLLDAQHDHPNKTIVLCAGRNIKVITRCALLLGGFFIVCKNMDIDEILDRFSPISSKFIQFQASSDSNDSISVVDCWHAIYRANKNGWLNLSSTPDFDRCIDMQEHLHYDKPANGSLHVIVPGKLLAFPCPADLPYGTTYADSDGERQFSACYYADIFEDFGVRMVVRCGGPAYDTRAFQQLGIGVEDLPVGGDAGAAGMPATGPSGTAGGSSPRRTSSATTASPAATRSPGP